MACAKCRHMLHAHRDRGAVDVHHSWLGSEAAAGLIAAGLGQEGRRGLAVIVAQGAAAQNKNKQGGRQLSGRAQHALQAGAALCLARPPVALQAVRLGGVIVVQRPARRALLQEAALPRVAGQAGVVLPAGGARPPAAAAAAAGNGQGPDAAKLGATGLPQCSAAAPSVGPAAAHLTSALSAPTSACVPAGQTGAWVSEGSSGLHSGMQKFGRGGGGGASSVRLRADAWGRRCVVDCGRRRRRRYLRPIFALRPWGKRLSTALSPAGRQVHFHALKVAGRAEAGRQDGGGGGGGSKHPRPHAEATIRFAGSEARAVRVPQGLRHNSGRTPEAAGGAAPPRAAAPQLRRRPHMSSPILPWFPAEFTHVHWDPVCSHDEAMRACIPTATHVRLFTGPAPPPTTAPSSTCRAAARRRCRCPPAPAATCRAAGAAR